MVKFTSFLFFIFYLFLFQGPLNAFEAEESIPKDPVLVRGDYLKIADSSYILISFKNEPHWHTYWLNPGDAGLPIRFDFLLDQKPIQLNSLPWPIPERHIEPGDIMAYGYQNEHTFYFPLNQNLDELKNKNLNVQLKWLVCKHVCIPGQKELTGTFTNNSFEFSKPAAFEISSEELLNRFNQLPKEVSWPSQLDLTLVKTDQENELSLFYTVTDIEGAKIPININLLTPYPLTPFDFKRENLYQDKHHNFYGKMTVAWDGAYQEPPINFPKNGIFEKPITFKFLYSNPINGQVEIVSKTFTQFSLEGFKESTSLMSLLQKVDTNKQPPKNTTAMVVDHTSTSLLFMLFFGFIGGLILNVMPCVLPVISLKLFGLLSLSRKRKRTIFLHNMFYSLGIVSSFVALAIIVLGLKYSGQSIGWGFQLQSPSFVALMIFVIFIFSLNLFGLFEFKTPGGSFLGDVQLKKGFGGDFLSGILATILSTPCSAPFLGTALTFAFTSGPLEIILIFIFIGLGLAFPFLITGIFPALISFLPKPGHWMLTVKKFLGMAMILTTLWLMDIFSNLIVSPSSLIKMFTALALIFFAFYMKKKITKNKPLLAFTFILPILFLGSIILSELSATPPTLSGPSNLIKEKRLQGLPWETWSPERMEELKLKKVPTFVDFTAKWCFTCKVNEKLVLETDEFSEFIKNNKITLLLADWTKRDEAIGVWLKSNGKVGIPAYFILTKEGAIIDLGETISMDEIKKAFY